jgi:hypothetical protein
MGHQRRKELPMAVLDLNIQVEETIPESTHRKGPRRSQALDVIEAARKASTKKVSVTAGEGEPTEKLYKSMIQWKHRHQDETVKIMKQGDRVWVWIED